MQHAEKMLQCQIAYCNLRFIDKIALENHRTQCHSELAHPTLPPRATIIHHAAHTTVPNLPTSAARRASPLTSSPSGFSRPSPILEGITKQAPRNSAQLMPTPKRTLDDDGPILRNPYNPTESLLAQAEKPIDQLAINNWGGYTLDALTKSRLNTEVKEWLRDEGNHSARFARLICVMRPLDDGPERGDSIFAKVGLPAYTLLGPYAGKLHDDTKSPSYSMEERAYGAHNVQAYSFGTRSKHRSASAYSSGNILSLVNTKKLPSLPGIPNKENNVFSVRVGKNITFYITKRAIKAGEELFINYGEEYRYQP